MKSNNLLETVKKNVKVNNNEKNIPEEKIEDDRNGSEDSYEYYSNSNSWAKNYFRVSCNVKLWMIKWKQLRKFWTFKTRLYIKDSFGIKVENHKSTPH